MTASDSASTGERLLVVDTVTVCRALTRVRSRGGSTCSSLVSALTELSSMPVMEPPAAVRRPTATATASSSSKSSGGILAPAPSWYPPATPGAALTG